MEKYLMVSEIFRTIHGEVNGVGGQGVWTIVLRLQGCNLKCSYCDTKYAIREEGGEKIGTSDVIEKINKLTELIGEDSFQYYPRNVLITGGEPLLQWESLIQFCSNLKHVTDGEIKIAVETNGTLAIHPKLKPNVDSFIVDFKTPSSGVLQLERVLILAPMPYGDLGENDYVKFLITDENDFSFALETKELLLQRHRLKGVTFLMSPVEGSLFKARKLYTMLEEANRFDFNINVQLHKMIGVK